MSTDVLIVAEHLDGALTDMTFELIAAGKALAAELGGSCVAALIGGGDELAGQLGAAAKVYRVDGPAFAGFNPESHLAALKVCVAAASPRAVLLGYTSTGMDLSSSLAMALSWPMASSCRSLRVDDGGIQAVANLYGGKLDVTVELGEGPCVISMLAGATSADAGRGGGAPEQVTIDAPAVAGRLRLVELCRPEKGDVDITTQEILVAVGRGIGSADGIELAQELADALGAAVAASRPIIDAGWLPKSRQVGKSGLKVKPKVYLALGISGAPEHLEGMKSSATIIAVNTDPTAPIFGVAHYGMTADLNEVCEQLVEALE